MSIVCEGKILVMPSGEQVDVAGIVSVQIMEASEAVCGVPEFSRRICVKTQHGHLYCKYSDASMATACAAHQIARA
jgi:hypothetical protein